MARVSQVVADISRVSDGDTLQVMSMAVRCAPDGSTTFFLNRRWALSIYRGICFWRLIDKRMNFFVLGIGDINGK